MTTYGDPDDDSGIEIPGSLEQTREVETVSVLRLKPGDLLVLRVPGELDAVSRADLQAALEDLVPEGVKVAVLEKGCTFQRVTVDEG